jgi:preprotein translocase subunit YajC
MGFGGFKVGNSSVIVWLIPIAFLVYMIWQQSRQRKRQQDMIDALKPGDSVVTVGGIIGTIRGVDGDIMSLEIADGVVVRLARGAISGKAETEIV